MKRRCEGVSPILPRSGVLGVSLSVARGNRVSSKFIRGSVHLGGTPTLTQ